MKGFHKLLFFMVLKCYYGIRPAIDLFAQLTVSPLNKPNSFHMCHFHSRTWHHFQPLNCNLHTLWWTNIAMENHHFSWENPLFLWSFSMAFCMFTRGYPPNDQHRAASSRCTCWSSFQPQWPGPSTGSISTPREKKALNTLKKVVV
jgi:hypothetical protein